MYRAFAARRKVRAARAERDERDRERQERARAAVVVQSRARGRAAQRVAAKKRAAVADAGRRERGRVTIQVGRYGLLRLPTACRAARRSVNSSIRRFSIALALRITKQQKTRPTRSLRTPHTFSRYVYNKAMRQCRTNPCPRKHYSRFRPEPAEIGGQEEVPYTAAVRWWCPSVTFTKRQQRRCEGAVFRPCTGTNSIQHCGPGDKHHTYVCVYIWYTKHT